MLQLIHIAISFYCLHAEENDVCKLMYLHAIQWHLVFASIEYVTSYIDEQERETGNKFIRRSTSPGFTTGGKFLYKMLKGGTKKTLYLFRHVIIMLTIVSDR